MDTPSARPNLVSNESLWSKVYDLTCRQNFFGCLLRQIWRLSDVIEMVENSYILNENVCPFQMYWYVTISSAGSQQPRPISTIEVV